MSNQDVVASPTSPADGLTRARSFRAIAAATAGTFIEWYEYGLYTYVAGLVIAPLFFPEGAGSVAVLATFATFAVGFAARPVGGIVLGAAGDRWGRRPVLIFSIILMGVATTSIGLLPPFAAIGIWAPALLVLFRLMQGFGAGAELASAMIYVNESTQQKAKGYHSSFLLVGSMMGAILSLVLFTGLSAALTSEAFLEWGWRVPFLLGAVLTVIGLLLRRKVGESPEFERVQRERDAGRAPMARRNPLAAMGDAFKASPRNFIAGFLLPSGLNVTGFVAQAFGISYLSGQIGLSADETLLTIFVMMGVGVLVLPLWGRLTDKLGAKLVLYAGAIGGIILAFPYFMALQTGNLPLIVVASVLIWAVGWAAGNAAQLIILPAIFRTEYRSSGLTSSRELQGALVAGPTPLIATALVLALGGAPWLVAAMIVLAQTMTIVGMLIARPTLTAEEVESASAHRGLGVKSSA
ncbi:MULTISPECIES: MFS transporter [unclassified Pseudoclavibacter]|uniref:MFS transporter n=1 Tax=unclassified Pseudoclavibacter TaxID=2615177 RepID=UPI000CE75EDC|nr:MULTISPECIES: MFS transporter [unclassified Pseudoclavibacter]MBF4550720.1 MFS transporter [Pseudoclavibacter sp. VKM Ac-2888]PPF34637.1 MFS transporter [Pseudoclavibacter sp. AY1H1]PPG05469.1 MFS transporter [Pseudoclavibacter sp. RFBI5]